MVSRQADTLFTGGLLVSGEGVVKCDVAVTGEIISSVGPHPLRVAAKEVIDASGLYIFPGIIDAHNHPINLDKMDSFTKSSAYGGVTTVIPFMQNMRSRGIEGSTSEIIQDFIEESHQISYLDFGVHAILLGDDDVTVEVPRLMDMGVISFKMYMTYPKRGMMMPDDKMLEAMSLASDAGGIAMVHAENGYCIDYLTDMFIEQGKTGKEFYAESQPRILEVEAANRAATYASVTGCPLYVVHLSAREVLNVIERFKSEGTKIFGETCPQYLDLTNQHLLDYGPLAKIGPPLREKADNEAMWKGLKNGVIDTIASDFCGFSKAHKYSGGRSSGQVEALDEIKDNENIFEASFGGNWTEQMLPVVFEEGVNKGRITLTRLVQVMCENPAKIFGIFPKKGTIKVGSDADIVLFDPTVQHTLSAEAQHCNSDFTMFEGKEVLGKPIYSMQRGRPIIKDGQILPLQGSANYLPGDVTLTACTETGYPVN